MDERFILHKLIYSVTQSPAKSHSYKAIGYVSFEAWQNNIWKVFNGSKNQKVGLK